MEELTMIMLIGCLIFYILHIIFKVDELNVMSLVMGVIALACVVKDPTIAGTEDMILFVAPLFYVILMSAVSLFPTRDKS